MFNNVLIPLDGSKTAEEVFTAIEKFLRRPDASGTVLRVASIGVTTHFGQLIRVLRRASHEYVGGIVRGLRARGFRVHGRVVEGDPAASILSVATERKCDLIAMTTHGRSGAGRFLLGSVAEKVLRHSTQPVLVVRSGAETREFRNLLLPLDGSEASEQILEPAVALARLHGADLALLEILEPIEEGAPALTSIVAEERENRERARLDALVARLRSEGLKATGNLRWGDAPIGILKFAEENSVDLICMTTHGRSGLSRWMLGSVAEKVLRHARVPVLLCRAQTSPLPALSMSGQDHAESR